MIRTTGKLQLPECRCISNYPCKTLLGEPGGLRLVLLAQFYVILQKSPNFSNRGGDCCDSKLNLSSPSFAARLVLLTLLLRTRMNTTRKSVKVRARADRKVIHTFLI